MKLTEYINNLEVFYVRKYKQFVIGVIVGAMLFSAVPIGAAIEEFICYRADYKVMINGEEYVSEDLPVLNYKGNTYAPFRSILEKAGLNVAWNAELGQAEVTSNPAVPQNDNVEDEIIMSNNIEYDPITGLPVGAEIIEYKRWKNAVRYNDNIYLSNSTLAGAGIFVRSDVKTNTITIERDGNTTRIDIPTTPEDVFLNRAGRAYCNVNLFGL
jgi:hypothetical protein